MVAELDTFLGSVLEPCGSDLTLVVLLCGASFSGGRLPLLGPGAWLYFVNYLG